MRYIFVILFLCQVMGSITTNAGWFSPFIQDRQDTETIVSPKKKTHKIGVLVPLSGPQKQIGDSILNAALLATYDMSGSKISLVPIDSGSTAESATDAALKAMEQGCDLIMGPVFSKQIMPVKNVLPSHINLISFSNDISKSGDNVFIAGYSHHPQAEFVIRSLTGHTIGNVMALLPKNAFGREIGPLFNVIVEGLLDKTPSLYYYDPNGVSDAEVDVIYDLIEKQEPTVIYVPEGDRKTLTLISKLKFKGLNLSDTLVFGSVDWNKPMFINDQSLKGALFPQTRLPASPSFIEQYEHHFSSTPNILSEIAYDLTHMLHKLNMDHPKSCLSKNALMLKKGFKGVRGNFYFDSTGQVHRQYILKELTGGTPKTVAGEENPEIKLSEKYRDLFED